MTIIHRAAHGVYAYEGRDGTGWFEKLYPFDRQYPGSFAAGAYMLFGNQTCNGCEKSSRLYYQRNLRGDGTTAVFLDRYSARPRFTFASALFNSACHFRYISKSVRLTTINSSPPLTVLRLWLFVWSYSESIPELANINQGEIRLLLSNTRGKTVRGQETPLLWLCALSGLHLRHLDRSPASGQSPQGSKNRPQ